MKMVTYKKADSPEELRQILELQQANLPKNLTQTQVRTQGFVTVEHDFELLRKMNDVCAHTLAIEQRKVVGYALSMHPKFGEAIEILKPMFAKIKEVYPGTSFLVMGQMCVTKSHRGKGVFRGLYKNMQLFTQPNFETIITEVDVTNTRSMQAHKAIGFKEICRYKAGGKHWSLIVLK